VGRVDQELVASTSYTFVAHQVSGFVCFSSFLYIYWFLVSSVSIFVASYAFHLLSQAQAGVLCLILSRSSFAIPPGLRTDTAFPSFFAPQTWAFFPQASPEYPRH
jgi:hypothetical protein